MKVKSKWHCAECGHMETKWVGQCAKCSAWNSFHEEIQTAAPRRFQSQSTAKPVRLKEIELQTTPRIKSNLLEFDRLVGGGIVPGSLSLIGGEPGIGKSTLLLQLSQALNKRILYISGEESVEQTASRAERLGLISDNVYFLTETLFDAIKAQIDAIQPEILIIDSIQVVYKSELSSAPGSVSQVRECTSEFMHMAKGRNLTTFLVGHVTKSGEIAGPRVLEHLVDTVLYFEGDRQQNFRLLRAIKNRFGPTDEIAVFSMNSEGLKEVPNPSELFLQERRQQVPGSVIIPTLEGTRPILIEVQALVSESAYNNPQRRSTGLDSNRLALLLAVLEKRLKYRLHSCDVFVSVAGGLRISEPAADLGVLLAIASSFCNIYVQPDTVVIGEVGLGGEIRGVSRIDARIKEASRMGFKKALVPRRSQPTNKEIQIQHVDLVEEAINALLSP